MIKYEVGQFIKRNRLFEPHSTLLVGVSGGPDSIALLDYLEKIKEEWDFRLIAVSVDHGLRGEDSKEDLDFVENYCASKSIVFRGVSLDVPSYKKKHKIGTQEAARKMRYLFFSEQMEAFQADYLVLAHHGDDQIETMFMRMTRGANPAAISGMAITRPFATGKLVRPFLTVTKEQIEAYCLANDLMPRRDPSNQEDIYTRNYFRMHILPLLKRQNPNLHQSIQKLSENIFDDMNYLDEQAKKASEEVIHYKDKPKHVTCSINLMKKNPHALQRRMFHLILNYLYDTLPSGLFYGHERQFFDLLHSGRANFSVNLPKNLQMTKTYQTVCFHFQQDVERDFCEQLAVPGRIVLPTGAEFTASIVTAAQLSKRNDKHYHVIQQSESLRHNHLVVRYRLPGDRIYLEGLKGRKKVKDIFIDKKIPLNQRDTWPLVVDEQGEILWVVGLARKTGINCSELNGDQFIQIEYKRH